MTSPTPNLDGLPGDLRSRIEGTFAALRSRGVDPVFVPDRPAALAKVLDMLPRHGLVSHGTSTTLIEIGLVDYLKRPDCGYRYGNSTWQAETDAMRRSRVRARVTAESDAFLGGVQAICETGEVVCADASGGRQAGYVYGPTQVIWVAGVNKLVLSLEDGLRRLRMIALPQEEARMKKEGAPGSWIGKIVIYERERPGRIFLVLVGETLGF